MRRGTFGRKRVVSLSCELHLAARALDGVRLLSEQWKELHFNEEELPRLAHALHAISVIVRERLVLLDRGVRDTIDPRLLLCDENRALEDAPSDEGDVLLRAWSTKKTAERLGKEAERAARRLASLRDRRKEVEPR